MFDFEREWSISLAGCGFLGIYYIGLASCFQERAPFLLREAKMIYGASAGAITATVLTLGLPLANLCEDLMTLVQVARGRSLGPLHPSCNLANIVRDALNRDLPADAHITASGRLCVSLTRMSDGQNVLVSQFSTRQELIQALVCSCFIPGYFGLIPPYFRGERYMDGALSNNQPQQQREDTLTVAPFCGDCVICPRDNAFSLRTVRVCSVSYRVSLLNLRRVARVFFPPEPQVMAEICQNGYKDGLQFLKENHLLRPGGLSAGLSNLVEVGATLAGCCGDEDDELQYRTNEVKPSKDWHWWLDKRTIDYLPVAIKKVLCEACREKHSLYTQLTDLLPVHSAYAMAQRLVQLIPLVAEEVKWLLKVVGDLLRQAWQTEGPGVISEALLCWGSSPTLGLLLCGGSHQQSADPPCCSQGRQNSPPLPLAPTPPPPHFPTAEATPLHSTDSKVSVFAPLTTVSNVWALCVTWAAWRMESVTFDPTL